MYRPSDVIVTGRTQRGRSSQRRRAIELRDGERRPFRIAVVDQHATPRCEEIVIEQRQGSAVGPERTSEIRSTERSGIVKDAVYTLAAFEPSVSVMVKVPMAEFDEIRMRCSTLNRRRPRHRFIAESAYSLTRPPPSPGWKTILVA